MAPLDISGSPAVSGFWAIDMPPILLCLSVRLHRPAIARDDSGSRIKAEQTSFQDNYIVRVLSGALEVLPRAVVLASLQTLGPMKVERHEHYYNAANSLYFAYAHSARRASNGFYSIRPKN